MLDVQETKLEVLNHVISVVVTDGDDRKRARREWRRVRQQRGKAPLTTVMMSTWEVKPVIKRITAQFDIDRETIFNVSTLQLAVRRSTSYVWAVIAVVLATLHFRRVVVHRTAEQRVYQSSVNFNSDSFSRVRFLFPYCTQSNSA